MSGTSVIQWGVAMTRPYRKDPQKVARRAEKRAAMKKLRDSGLTYAAIGAVYGCSFQNVSRIINGTTSEDTPGGRRRAHIRIQQQKEAISRKYGCTYSQYLELLALKKPLNAFNSQKTHAKIRGIAWELTLWDWWQIWLKSGHWDDRGYGSGAYCMCRYGDVGAYAADNVYIATHDQNMKDYFAGKGKHRSRWRDFSC